MKKFLAIIILGLCFVTPSQANDIRDWKIEGMSIGDSLLDYFSEEEIKNKIMSNYYKNKKFTSVEFINDTRFKTYGNVEINYLTKDNNYIIESISGAILCPKNFSKCEDLRKDIKSDISEQFKNLKKESYNKNHLADKSGNSKVSHDLYRYKNGDMIIIELINWSEKITKKNRWTDNVSLNVRTNKFNQFLRIAYK